MNLEIVDGNLNHLIITDLDIQVTIYTGPEHMCNIMKIRLEAWREQTIQEFKDKVCLEIEKQRILASEIPSSLNPLNRLDQIIKAL